MRHRINVAYARRRSVRRVPDVASAALTVRLENDVGSRVSDPLEVEVVKLLEANARVQLPEGESLSNALLHAFYV